VVLLQLLLWLMLLLWLLLLWLLLLWLMLALKADLLTGCGSSNLQLRHLEAALRPLRRASSTGWGTETPQTLSSRSHCCSGSWQVSCCYTCA
jgi:hypothetical protein